MRKRSLTIAGHRTSIALEPQFWEALEQIAADKNLSLSQLVAQIDESRSGDNLSSAIRVAILNYFKIGKNT